MIWLDKGDNLPSVAMMQEALNIFLKTEHEKKSAKQSAKELEKLVVDGVYGRKTKTAVEAFQTLKGRHPNGVISPDTWKDLKEYCPYQIISMVDLFDPSHRHVNIELRKLGDTPINPPFLSNALELLGKQVPQMVKKNGKVGILRLYGHGNSGSQNLSKGLGGIFIDPANPKLPRGDARICKRGEVMDIMGRRACVFPSAGGQALALGDKKREDGREYHEFFEVAKNYLAPLRGCFARYGSLEMHGCQIAKGKKGEKLVGMLALFLGVPVTATRGDGKIATTKELLRVERPWLTWFPFGFDMKTWINTRDSFK